MSDSTRTLLHRWFDEVWNQGREDAIDELMREDAVAHGLSGDAGAPLRGPAGFKPFYRRFRAAFPDIRITVEDCVVQGDRIMARCHVTATHSGPGLTPEPTGRRVSFTGMCMIRTQDGKLAEGWNNFDFLELYQQLGMRLT